MDSAKFHRPKTMEGVHGKLGQVERVLKLYTYLCIYLSDSFFVLFCFFKIIPYFGRERKHTSAKKIKLVTVHILVKKSPLSPYLKS